MDIVLWYVLQHLHDGDPDHAHYQLDARYFTQTKNSWEIDNYKDERLGSSMRDDHGPLWITFISDGQFQSEMVGIEDPVRICNLGIFWTFCCFSILLFMSASFISGTYKAGIMAILLFELNKYYVYMIFGSRDAFRFVGLLLLYLYVCNNITNIIENRGKFHHYLFMLVFCFLSMNGHAGNAFIMLGMFIIVGIIFFVYKTNMKNIILCGLSVLLRTLLGSLKTLSIF